MSEDDIRLWSAVKKTAKPLRRAPPEPPSPDEPAEPPAPPKAAAKPKPAPPALPAYRPPTSQPRSTLPSPTPLDRR
ncbi:MAG: hypothetical protein RLO48_19965, partial [Bauldia litoralis]